MAHVPLVNNALVALFAIQSISVAFAPMGLLPFWVILENT
jgi:hypothetical protein